MAAPRRVTEEDLHVTEALIADSFRRLKKSVAAAPHEVARPAADLIREHPLAATATAAGAGVIAFQVMKMLVGRPAHGSGSKVKRAGSDLTGELLSMATPLIVSLFRQQLSRAVTGERK